MNFNKKQKRGFGKGVTAFQKFSFLLLLFTFFLSACSEKTNNLSERPLNLSEREALEDFLQGATINGFEHKQRSSFKKADRSGTYYVAASSQKGDRDTVFLIIPPKLGKKMGDGNIYELRKESWGFTDMYMDEDLKSVGIKLDDFDDIISDSIMKSYMATYKLDWRKVEVNKDLTFE
ncbi:hypothetical protein AALF16_06150 [Bacillus cereus]|uniref:hypothetical protein n=1 Tax=Bacillus cereus TaxID=1396 RepID=UPI00356F91A3